jgi:RNA polymerase sigma-70 factor (ECF subfamily)
MLAEGDAEDWDRERTAMRMCLRQLTDRHRELFLLRYGENIKGPSLAEKVGIKVKSLRTTLLRIRRFLRDCVDARLRLTATEGDASRE